MEKSKMKITPNQIRTGNIFLYDVNGEWQPTILDWQDIKWCEEKNEEFNREHKPMPLTEELIELFGFMLKRVITHDFKLNKILRKDKIYQLDDEDDEGDGFEIEVIKNGDDNEIRRIGIKGIHHYDASNIKYAHKLQNICFELKGYELVLNKTKTP